VAIKRKEGTGENKYIKRANKDKEKKE